MPERKYSETAFYDFDKNYQDAVDLVRSTFGDERADALVAAKGRNTRTDFTTAITWGWMFHRPLLSITERALILIGNETAKGLIDAAARPRPAGDVRGAGPRSGARGDLHPHRLLRHPDVGAGGERSREARSPTSTALAGSRGSSRHRYRTCPSTTTTTSKTNFTNGVDISPAQRRRRQPRRPRDAACPHGRVIGGRLRRHPLGLDHAAALPDAARSGPSSLIGSDTANKGYLALKDHVRLGPARRHEPRRGQRGNVHALHVQRLAREPAGDGGRNRAIRRAG